MTSLTLFLIPFITVLVVLSLTFIMLDLNKIRIIRFRRLSRKPEYRMTNRGTVVQVWIWEIAFSEGELYAKLNGDMAEIIMPEKPWLLRAWRSFFPLKGYHRAVSIK